MPSSRGSSQPSDQTQVSHIAGKFFTSEPTGNEYWSGQPIPLPGYLPNPGMKSRSPAWQVDSLPAELLGKPQILADTYLLPTSYNHCAKSLTIERTIPQSPPFPNTTVQQTLTSILHYQKCISFSFCLFLKLILCPYDFHLCF